MLFNSLAFVSFLAIVLGAYWLLPWRRVQHVALLVASLFFYGWWDYRFIPLIAYVVLVAWGSAHLLHKYASASRRILWVSLVALLGQLAIFKYTNFLVSLASDAVGLVGPRLDAAHFDIVLPVGISFYTFQALSYIVDTRRGYLKKPETLLSVGVYVAFFPQLVAGPIVRADQFLPQLEERRQVESRDLLVALKLSLLGLIYKGVLADRIGVGIDPVFESPGAFGTESLWKAALGFYAQIYFDFAGYSTMAIGISRAFGFRLPKNFDFPYRATSVTEFWRRWHISLSTWLRDYLYIPLGGSRGSKLARYRNLMLTMLLGGLWHGASSNFVLWGGLHGGLLAVHKWWTDSGHRLPWVPAWLVTQFFVLMLWIPFRAPTWDATLTCFEGLFTVSPPNSARAAEVPWLLIVVPLLVDHLQSLLKGSPATRVPAWAAAVALGLLFALSLPFIRMDVNSFIYFQF